MAAVNSNELEDNFIEAKNNWELEKLYVDLAFAKRKALTPVEKKFLRGLLCGCSPAEIATVVYQSSSSSTVRVYLSNGLYKYIEEMLSNQTGHSVEVKNWSRVTHLLEKAGYRKGWLQVQPVITSTKSNEEPENHAVEISSHLIQDWGEAIDVNIFHGRAAELATVQKWIVQDRCRLVLLLGMGGIGKTAFSIKLAQEVKDKFEYLIWRSLRLAPPLELILDQLLENVSPLEKKTAITLDNKISLLIDCLRSSRCLIVLDDVDSILSSENEIQEDAEEKIHSSSIKNTFLQSLFQIRYRHGYEGYGELIRRVGDSQHQSCLILTSREKPPEIAAIEGEILPVHSLKLTGLSQQESTLLLKAKGFTNLQKQECKVLIDSYAGNPLFIKLVATTIQELFDGSIYEFVEQGIVVFGEIRAILDQQFNRLSELEKQIMYLIALNPDFVSVQKLQQETIPGLSKRLSQRLILEVIELLQKRSLLEKATHTLIEKQASSFTQTPVLRQYIIERLIVDNFKSSPEKEGYLLMNQTILEAQLKNFVHESHLNAEI